MKTIELPFDIGDRVHMDGMNDLIGHVTAISIGVNGLIYEVSWWSERTLQSGWFRLGRLTEIYGDRKEPPSRAPPPSKL